MLAYDEKIRPLLQSYLSSTHLTWRKVNSLRTTVIRDLVEKSSIWRKETNGGSSWDLPASHLITPSTSPIPVALRARVPCSTVHGVPTDSTQESERDTDAARSCPHPPQVATQVVRASPSIPQFDLMMTWNYLSCLVVLIVLWMYRFSIDVYQLKSDQTD